MNACRVIKNGVGTHDFVARGSPRRAHASYFLLLSELDIVFLNDLRLLVVFFVGLIVFPSFIVLP